MACHCRLIVVDLYTVVLVEPPHVRSCGEVEEGRQLASKPR
jgi:hypothetical protein